MSHRCPLRVDHVEEMKSRSLGAVQFDVPPLLPSRPTDREPSIQQDE